VTEENLILSISGVTIEKRGPARGAGLALNELVTPESSGRLWGRLYLCCKNLPATDPPFGLRHGAERYEACWPLLPGHPLSEGLAEFELPGGLYAVAVHEGAYDKIAQTLEGMLKKWLPQSGFSRGDGPVIERYLNDPRGVPEEGLRTEVCLPVTPDPVE